MASLNVIGGEIRSQPLNENFQNINTGAQLYGTGSAEMYAASSAPAYILVEDIGPA